MADAARYTTQAGRAAHSSRRRRESLGKRLGRVARAIRERDGHACVYCGATAESSGARLHLDHLVPKSAGGLDAADNLVTACGRCNGARQAMTLARWEAYARAKLGLTFTARGVRARARRTLAKSRKT